ncbi:putative beta-galactosidase [Pseudomassariella vexata]|uniref:Beta-galactosidase n=1 Tax=Pseudomassariella vexata TaxID=1141098 RepID=A0A1Y2DAS5_9PEZI|nr:putative beta-galactosidase [Pseudomassariella vexata]ORY56373.1 putative beta-galactosidase [Pseudomassariella vexata]
MSWIQRVVAILLSFCCVDVLALTLSGQHLIVAHPGKREALQNLVTWDEHSLFVRGERIMLYSGEFHPWRLPVPGLWLDVFHKIKALGYTGVSFYVDWALLEGNPGHFTAEGVFAWEPFFAAAAEAGIYLIARPGPYINAEVSGGGFPGWLQRIPDILRTKETGYVDATENYVAHIGKLIADAQITNGGPVIALQTENEYTYGADWIKWPDVAYIEAVNEQFRRAGIVVPLINNEAAVIGLFTPEKPGGPNIYGHDSYPIGWDCANPEANWVAGKLPTDWRELHLQQSPDTPYSVVEFQGGAIDNWGGPGLEGCAVMTNHEFERLFFKNDFSFGMTILNIYMTYGGTNWGNLGQSGGYTSYDYGAAIKEDRTIGREKYAEAKLIANFITSSPAYLDATPGNLTNTSYVSTTELSTTPIFGKTTTFYVTRHSAYESLASTPYVFTVPTSIGNVTIPQLGGSLTMKGRDTKIHVTDYDVGGINLLYSSADIYTHRRTDGKRVLLMYGGAGETHELAFSNKLGKPIVEGGSAKIETKGSAVVVQWEVTPTRKVLHYGSNLDVYLLWRNDAFKYWVLELEAPAPIGNYSSQKKDTIIAKAGYLLRTATKIGTSLHLTGDLNATADLEILAGLPGSNNIYFNGQKVPGVKSANGRLSAILTYSPPSINLPSLADLDWKYLDSLPEIKPGYDDSAWVQADHTTTNNTARDDYGTMFLLKTPTSLIAGDYGFSTGSLIYRGYFAANGNESSLYLSTTGGSGFGHSVWINETYVGSWSGNGLLKSYNQTLALPSNSSLKRGSQYVLTVLIDHMGQETSWTPGYDTMKTPRGIIDYSLSGHVKSDISWKVTGNMGGEQYRDQLRGPFNEGGMYAERQGYHLPNPPTADWDSASPLDGIDSAGVGFYAASCELDIPAGYDVPLSFVFANTTDAGGAPADLRVQLYVNGWQFGKYINNLGPQIAFPVPEGTLNYAGTNYLAITLWSQEADGGKLGSLELAADAVIQSGMKKPALTWDDQWVERDGAF